jgi:hypothetical protein
MTPFEFILLWSQALLHQRVGIREIRAVNPC